MKNLLPIIHKSGEFTDIYYERNRQFYIYNGICRNKLKEEITANTTFNPIGTKMINPVRHSSKIRYNSDGGQGSGGTFQEALENARERETKVTKANVTPEETLERMAGLNQYDRHAREIFFTMSSQADYQC